MSIPDYSKLFQDLASENSADFSTKVAKNRFVHCARAGILKHAVPQEFGGYDDGFTELCQTYQLMGEKVVDPALIISLHAHIWGSIFPILKFGSKNQKEYIPQLIDGSIIAGHAITEPDAGSDIGAMQTIAKSVENGFVINGHKRYITNAAIADWILVYALLEDKIATFFVKCSDGGADFTSTHRVSGFKNAPIGEIFLNDCFIPKDRILGGNQDNTALGSILIQYALELERAFLFSGILGIMQWQLDEIVKHVKKRVVNNEPIGTKQAISHRIADMRLRVDILKLLIFNCANLKDNNRRITIESSEVKLFASESFLQSSLDAVQFLGSKGIEPESKFGHFVQDALATRIFSGASEIQRNIISALMGLRKRKVISK